MSEDGENVACVVVQGEGDTYAIVTLQGRPLTVTEQGYTELERLLVAAAWGIRRLANFAMYVPSVRVVVPDATMLASI